MELRYSLKKCIQVHGIKILQSELLFVYFQNDIIREIYGKNLKLFVPPLFVIYLYISPINTAERTLDTNRGNMVFQKYSFDTNSKRN